jgi:hypothetical protein
MLNMLSKSSSKRSLCTVSCAICSACLTPLRDVRMFWTIALGLEEATLLQRLLLAALDLLPKRSRRTTCPHFSRVRGSTTSIHCPYYAHLTKPLPLKRMLSMASETIRDRSSFDLLCSYIPSAFFTRDLNNRLLEWFQTSSPLAHAIKWTQSNILANYFRRPVPFTLVGLRKRLLLLI